MRKYIVGVYLLIVNNTITLQMRCETASDGVLPGKHVIDALVNNRHFSDAFQCPVGSPMNPDTKCPALPDVPTTDFRGGGKPAMVLSPGPMTLPTCNSTLRTDCVPPRPHSADTKTVTTARPTTTKSRFGMEMPVDPWYSEIHW